MNCFKFRQKYPALHRADSNLHQVKPPVPAAVKPCSVQRILQLACCMPQLSASGPFPQFLLILTAARRRHLTAFLHAPSEFLSLTTGRGGLCSCQVRPCSPVIIRTRADPPRTTAGTRAPNDVFCAVIFPKLLQRPVIFDVPPGAATPLQP